MEEGALKDGGKELDGHGGGLIVMEKRGWRDVQLGLEIWNEGTVDSS